MGNLIIKGKGGTGNKLILQDQAGGAVLTTADSGATIADGVALGTPASGVATNLTGIPTSGLTGAISSSNIGTGQILQVIVMNSSSRTSSTSTGWYEPGSNGYRLTLTPKFTNSVIAVNWHIPMNQASSSNVLFNVKIFRIIDGGSKSYQIDSAGGNVGVGYLAGGCFRPLNGYDTNDNQVITLQGVDRPNTTGVCVYGFEWKPEGSNTTTFGYSQSTNSTWGYDTDICGTATEVKQ